MTAAARLILPAKPLRVTPPEAAAWHQRQAARLVAPTARTHPLCLSEKGIPANYLPRSPSEAPPRSRLPYPRAQAQAVAIAVSPARLPCSSQPAPYRGTQTNLQAETRCPRHSRELPAPGPLERAAAPCAEAALFPGGESPSSPTYFSGRNASIGSGTHGN